MDETGGAAGAGVTEGFLATSGSTKGVLVGGLLVVNVDGKRSSSELGDLGFSTADAFVADFFGAKNPSSSLSSSGTTGRGLIKLLVGIFVIGSATFTGAATGVTFGGTSNGLSSSSVSLPKISVAFFVGALALIFVVMIVVVDVDVVATEGIGLSFGTALKISSSSSSFSSSANVCPPKIDALEV